MKRSISFVLCLALLVSMFSVMGISVSAAEVDYDAAAQKLFTIKEGTLSNGKITYTVYVKPNVKISGAILYAEFDTEVFEVSGASSGVIPGECVEGYRVDAPNQYSMAFLYYDPLNDYKVGSSSKALMKFTFKAIHPDRPASEIKFFCDEFDSITDKSLNIEHGSSGKIASYKISSLSVPPLGSVTNVAGGLKVTWDTVKGATGYEVFKSTDGKTWDSAEKVSGFDPAVYGEETYIIDEDVKNNTQYKYYVRAVNASGNTKYSGTSITGRYLISPASVKLTKDGTSITVKWSAVEGANTYRVYRRIINADGTYGSWSTLKSGIKELTYKDTSVNTGTARNYQYSVRSFASDAASVHTSFAEIKFTPRPATTVKTVYNGVKVTWEKVNGATAYTVSRKVYGGSWVVVATLGENATTYTDKGATSNKKIYYRVVAEANGAKSGYETKNLNFLKAPTPKAANAASGIKVTWTKMTGATKYVVYRKAGTAKSWTKLATVTGTSYTDKTAKSGTTYSYTVKAYNGKVYSGYNPTGAKVVRLAQPKIASATSNKTGIALKWGKITGANSYEIYRKTGSGAWVKLTTVTKGTTVTFTDKTAKKGVTYTYRMRAVSTSTGTTYRSGYSATISCKDKY